MHGSGTTRRWTSIIAALLAAVMTLTACTNDSAGPRPEVPDSQVQQLVTALSSGKVDAVPWTDSTGVAEDFTAALGSMGISPKVTSKTVTVQTEDNEYVAIADLQVTWALPSGDWTYDSTATLEHSSEWKVRWDPSILHPQLTHATRLVRTQTLADRASITDRSGAVLAGLQDGYRIGLDKTFIPAKQWESSARLLATAVGIDPDTYVKKVKGYGAKAWVLAAEVAGYSAPSAVYDIPGATAQKASVYGSAPGRATTFAQPLLGTTGEATQKIIDASEGEVVAGDTVGVSGLQLLYDKQLRGTPGVEISVGTRPASSSASPKASSSSSVSATPQSSSASATGSATPSASEPMVLLKREPVAGKTLKLTLDAKKQTEAEKVLATTKQAALVAVDPSTGQVLAAATTTDSSVSIATQGRYPPGSTFKVITSLALLRAGFTEQSAVTCNATTVVNGRTLKNYSDYPSNKLGSISLKTALAESCNTAFVSQYNKLSADALAKAAGSLGVGIDYEPGYYSFWGSVPSPTEAVARAEAMIGQGEVLVSPLAMAAAASSVSAGKTVIPTLISGKTITSTGTALTAAEAKSLQSMMAAVVNEGSGTSLKGVVTGAKSGTAEYGSGSAIKTHAWMMGYKGTSLAVSVFVTGGGSGTSTAGPLLSGFVKAVA